MKPQTIVLKQQPKLNVTIDTKKAKESLQIPLAERVSQGSNRSSHRDHSLDSIDSQQSANSVDQQTIKKDLMMKASRRRQVELNSPLAMHDSDHLQSAPLNLLKIQTNSALITSKERAMEGFNETHSEQSAETGVTATLSSLNRGQYQSNQFSSLNSKTVLPLNCGSTPFHLVAAVREN